MRRAFLVAAVAGGCGGKGEPPTPDYRTYPLAGDIVLDKITWYQGVEKVLYLGPGVFGGGAQPPPVIVGREAMVRVAVSALDEYHPKARDVAIVLETTGGGYTSSRGVVVDSASWEESELGTTAVFPLPGEYVTADLELTVSVHEVDRTRGGLGSTAETVWTSATDGLDFETSAVEKLVIVPIKYMADGSGRVPDTSPARLAEIATAYHAMYPVLGLEIEVLPPLAWVPAIEPFSGWETLLAEISGMRAGADEPPNTYYYGLFDPAESLGEYCGGGCILGLSNLGYDPSQDWMRASIGLGFDDGVISTLVHEVGHAHGREHAPCELLGQPSDPQYPYINARLGSWGYDLASYQLVDPQATADMMSYCNPQWVSDYTFNALLDRAQALEGLARAPKRAWHRLLVDGDGVGRPYGTIRAASPTGEPVTFELLDGDGVVVGEADGWLVPYSHLDGGTALLAELDPDVVSARLRR